MSIRRLVLLACLVAPTGVAAKPPNIVVFISDDMGRADCSVYGSPVARTPTMQMLADRGMTFDNAYVASPSCCPNRASLLTGLMPARHGAHPNHTPVREGTKFLVPELKKLGYTVGSFGKVAHGSRNFAGCDHHSKVRTDMAREVEEWFVEGGFDGPVCLFVGDRRPHVTWVEDAIYDPEDVTLPWHFVDTPETRKHWARYLTDITGMDEEMGRVYRLARKRFGDDFLFLFTSDHGGQWPLGKWNLYDFGAAVPLIVAWPGHVEPGVRTDAWVSWVDLLPTLIDIAGGRIPEGIDGRSFGKVLTGESSTHRDRMFTTHTGDGVMNIFPMRAVRIGKYKLVHNLCPGAYHTTHSDQLRRDGGGAFWHSWHEAAGTDAEAAAAIRRYHRREEFELFDLEKDPEEKVNLAKNPEYRETLAKLRAELAAWTKAQGDDLQPHQEPYPASKPVPKVTMMQKRGARKRPKEREYQGRAVPSEFPDAHHGNMPNRVR